jgi:hypothetical protein
VGGNEKVLYATHYLVGQARAWWISIRDIQPEGQVMPWDELKESFRKLHVPYELIKLMRDKSCNLKQGNMSVLEYLERFTDLARYAPDDVELKPRRRSTF